MGLGPQASHSLLFLEQRRTTVFLLEARHRIGGERKGMFFSLLNRHRIKVAVFLVMSAVGNRLDGQSVTSAQAPKEQVQERLSQLADPKPPHERLVHLVEQQPVSATQLESGALLVDFGRVAFGNLRLITPEDCDAVLQVRFGENLVNGRVDRDPPGTVRYSEVRVDSKPLREIRIQPPVDARNTRVVNGNTPPPVLTPSGWGVVAPFRWVEIEGLPKTLKNPRVVRLAAFAKDWNDGAADFECSDETLNRVWDLCRYSIKATTFAGIYVDGDRERIPYEADAYINQLGHYYADGDTQMARLTFDWLMEHPTWPTEWAPHMVFMTHADWMQAGDVDWLAPRYESLKAKTLMNRIGPSGLIHSSKAQIDRDDIIDWPRMERDDYVHAELNTVVNAFHIAAVERMAVLAAAVGNEGDARLYQAHAKRLRGVFNETFFDTEAGLYRDGAGVDHHSLHANFFPLAFGLVEGPHRLRVTRWLAERGMRCSVYGAQYYLEGLFENGAAKDALDLMIAPGKRSWRHMLDAGATITWEAWDVSFKPNLDWNHAWGAAPANLLPRYVLGIQPQTPGWDRVRVRPCPGDLASARGKVPTPHGPVLVDWSREPGMRLALDLPEGITAAVEIPAHSGSKGVRVNGRSAEAELHGNYWILAKDLAGGCVIDVR